MPTGKVSPAINARVVPVVSVSTTLPAWAAAISPGRWEAASTNTFMSVDSNLAGADFDEIMRNYNGAAAVPAGSTAYPTGAMLFWGGGHSDQGFDSSVVALDLGTRLYTRIEGPGVGPFTNGPVGTYPNGVFADGVPVPTHTYCYPAFDPVSESFVIPRGGSAYGQDYNTRVSRIGVCHVYNLAASAWRVGPPNRSNDTFYAAGGWSVWDTRRNCIWTRPCNSSISPTVLVKYEGLGSASGGIYGTLTNYSYADSGYNEADAAFVPGAAGDGSEDLIVYTKFEGTTKILRAVPFNGANVPQSRITLTMGGTPPGVLRKDGALMWSARRNSLIYYDSFQPVLSGWPALSGPALVYELRAPTNRVTGTWTWNLLTDQAGTTFPQVDTGTGGFYSKARIIKYDDGEIMVAAVRPFDPAYAFRIP